MHKPEIVAHIQELTAAYDLTPERYITIGSSVIAMLEALDPPASGSYRNIGDIDIVTDELALHKMLADGWDLRQHANGCQYVVNDPFEVSTCWTDGRGGLWLPRDLERSKVYIGDSPIPFIHPATLRYWKNARGWPKDQADVRRLDRLAYDNYIHYEPNYRRQVAAQASALD